MGSSAIIAGGQSGPSWVVVDDTHVYWANDDGGQVRRRGVNGGAQETIASSQPGPVAIAVDAAHVYWANAAGGVSRISRCACGY